MALLFGMMVLSGLMSLLELGGTDSRSVWRWALALGLVTCGSTGLALRACSAL